MLFRRLFAAIAAVVLCAVTLESAHAYPTTARSGTTTVTGVYRPLDLNLSLSDGTDAVEYYPGIFGGGASYFGFSATYTGTYSGYATTGAAGNWQLSFSYFGTAAISDDGLNTITLLPGNLSNPVGRLTYLGGGNYSGVPLEDTPQDFDFFNLFATSADPLLKVTCSDGVATCTAFTVQLLQNLEHLGPYVYDGVEGSVLDDGNGCVYDALYDCIPRPLPRVNQACIDAPNGHCGMVPAGFIASSVPEPASVGLVGLALLVLAMGRGRGAPRTRRA